MIEALQCIGFTVITIVHRERYNHERLSLESNLSRLREELNSAYRQLQLETRWKERAAAEHKKQLSTITHLQCKSVFVSAWLSI